MKQVHIIATLAVAATVVYGQTSASTQAGKSLLTSLSSSLTSAMSVSGSYVAQDIGGEQRTYTVTLQKPNMARVDTPTILYISDGKNITIYDKEDQSFVKLPFTESDLKGVFSYEDLNIWSGFFTENAFKPVAAVAKGAKTVNGNPAKVLEAIYDAKEQRVVTYYIDSTDGIAHKALVQYGRKEQDPKSVLIDASKVAVNTAIKPGTFEFTAPADARELTVDEYNGNRWYTDLNQAMNVAKNSGKRIFVDFMASWCGPCKRLEHDVFSTTKFKQLSRKFVFLRIDVDEQPSVSERYKVEAMPTQMVLNADGSVVATRVGYSNAADFFAFILGA